MWKGCYGRWLRVELIKIYPMLNERIGMLYKYVIIWWRFNIDTLVAVIAFPPKGKTSNTNEHPRLLLCHNHKIDTRSPISHSYVRAVDGNE
jgi:hypothetical protein